AKKSSLRRWGRWFEFVEADQGLLSVRQINSDFTKSCQALNAKIFRFTFLEIGIITSPSRPTRGAFRDRHDALGRNAMDALASGVFFAPDENAKAYGEVVWSWRRDAGAKLAGSIPPATVAKKPAHR